jgi:hypothetical protein
MKVLLISNSEPDYLCDAILHGMYHLLGSDFTHSRTYDLMYEPLTTPEKLNSSYGKGFTMWGNLPKYLNDNIDLGKKITNKYFDLIIYGHFRRCMDYYPLVMEYYDKHEVIFVDGEDDQWISDTQGHPLFKRELLTKTAKVYPISFAIPHIKLTQDIPLKTIKLSEYVPQVSGSGYIYNTENDYYEGYRTALYGLTHKKSGWDCMRHYEILGNGCIPYFPDINDCPDMTMTNFPKDLVKRSNQLFDTDCDEQYEILEKLHTYTKENLTTIELAKYVLSIAQ